MLGIKEIFRIAVCINTVIVFEPVTFGTVQDVKFETNSVTRKQTSKNFKSILNLDLIKDCCGFTFQVHTFYNCFPLELH